MALPRRIAPGKRVTTEVQSTDIMPTLLDLEGIRIPSEVDGTSLLPLLDGKSIAPRPVVIEGRGAQSIRDGDWRLVLRSPVARRLRKGDIEFEKAVELYNLKDDPGERREVSALHRDVVERLRSELEHVLFANRSQTQSSGKTDAHTGTIYLRFATAGRSARVRGTISLMGEGSLRVVPDGGALSASSRGLNRFEVDFQSAPDRALGLKLVVEPPEADVLWQWSLDGSPWPNNAAFGGPLGVSIPKLSAGTSSAIDDELVVAEQPYVNAGKELGIFVSRELRLDANSSLSESAQLEAQQAMQAWGYVRKPEVVSRRRGGVAP